MKASICMATHNRAPKVLAQVFDSIFLQKPSFECEVIVCDDGPESDAAKDICLRYPINYHRITRPPGRKNPCVARNVAYRAARGDVIIAQSDDVMHVSQNAIETLVRELECNPTSFIIASVIACGPDGKGWSVYTGKWHCTMPGHAYTYYERNVPFFFLGALRRRDVCLIGGNDEEFADVVGYEDKWFADCLMNGLGMNAVYVDSVVGHHLYHECIDTKEEEGVAISLYERKVSAAKSTGIWKAAGGAWEENASVFDKVFSQNVWGSDESRSGAGSSMASTQAIRRALPNLLHLLGIRSILDVPCGDFYWMNCVDLDSIAYVGADISKSVIEHNRTKYPSHTFEVLDVRNDDLPVADLVLCRDCLGHLSFDDCFRAIQNIKRSGARYLLATTFWNHDNGNLKTGFNWSPRSMRRAPFVFPPPVVVVDEQCADPGSDNFKDKSLGLWKVRDL
ncbi:MAG: glycosyltransferase [bacterium]